MKKLHIIMAIVIGLSLTGCGWGAKEQGVLLGAGGVLLLPTMIDNGKRLFGAEERPRVIERHYYHRDYGFQPYYR